MTTRVITFRLDDESATGQIFGKWEESGYKPRQIVEMGLRMLEGLEPEPINEMSDGALSQLKEIVGRLETVVESIEQNGGTITPLHQEQIDDVLDTRFVKGMQRIVRPGFTAKPEQTYEDRDELQAALATERQRRSDAEARVERLEHEVELLRGGLVEQKRMVIEWLDDMGYDRPYGWQAQPSPDAGRDADGDGGK